MGCGREITDCWNFFFFGGGGGGRNFGVADMLGHATG